MLTKQDYKILAVSFNGQAKTLLHKGENVAYIRLDAVMDAISLFTTGNIKTVISHTVKENGFADVRTASFVEDEVPDAKVQPKDS